MRGRLLFAIVLVGCDAGPPPTLTSTYSGLGELIPNGEIGIDWTLSGGEGEVTIDAASADGSTTWRLYDRQEPEGRGSFQWTGVDAVGEPLPSDTYRIAFSLDGAPVDADLHVMIDSFTFTDPAPGTTVIGTGIYYVKFTCLNLQSFTFTVHAGTRTILSGVTDGSTSPHEVVGQLTGVPAGTYPVSIDIGTLNFPDYATFSGGTIDFTP